MIQFRLRPSFEIAIATSRSEAIRRLTAHSRELGRGRWFRMADEYGEMHLDPAEVRLWSPHLSFDVIDTRGDGTCDSEVDSEPKEEPCECVVRARFAPRFEVWSGVWAIYLAMTFSAFFGAIIAYSQWMVGEWAWGGYVVIFSLLMIVVLHVIACTGQHWSSDQMDHLRARLSEVIQNSGLTS